MTSVFIIDDEAAFCRSICEALKSKGYKCDYSTDPKAGVELTAGFGLVLLDIRMPGLNGIEALRLIKKKNPAVNVVILTGHPTSDTINEAMVYGACDYLVKPFGVDQITAMIKKIDSGAV
jgi:DNA-binding NtrC family response regulator